MATAQHAAAAGGPSVTLVIGSGSVKCAAAIGVVKVLAEAGIRIERVVGCSGGALFAASIATSRASFHRSPADRSEK